MKQSYVTGEYIYAQIKKLENEMSKANEALTSLSPGTLAYSVVADVRDGKRAEIRKLKNMKFITEN